MKRMICAFGLLMMLMPGMAWAGFQMSCSLPQGGTVAVSFVDEKWTIIHRREGKRGVSREDQYDVQDVTDNLSKERRWQGMRYGNRNLRMVGTAKPSDGGRYSYEETLFDDGKGGKQVDRFFADGCWADTGSIPDWSIPGSQLSRSVVRFRPDTPYDEARVRLKALGYEPVRVSHNPKSCSIGFERRCKRYPETNGCSGTGLARCTFTWQSRGGALIEVGTIGETDPPIVDYVQCRKNCRALKAENRKN